MPEADMVDTVAHWIDLVAAMLTADAARLTLRRHIREMLRQGTIPTMQVIAAAEAGHQDADMALREAAAEYISRREEMPTEIANYVQRALVMPPVTYPPGRNLADTWLRDVGIAVIVQLAVERWRLPATATAPRPNRPPATWSRSPWGDTGTTSPSGRSRGYSGTTGG
jgi:hypothetical protein